MGIWPFEESKTEREARINAEYFEDEEENSSSWWSSNGIPFWGDGDGWGPDIGNPFGGDGDGADGDGGAGDGTATPDDAGDNPYDGADPAADDVDEDAFGGEFEGGTADDKGADPFGTEGPEVNFDIDGGETTRDEDTAGDGDTDEGPGVFGRIWGTASGFGGAAVGAFGATYHTVYDNTFGRVGTGDGAEDGYNWRDIFEGLGGDEDTDTDRPDFDFDRGGEADPTAGTDATDTEAGTGDDTTGGTDATGDPTAEPMGPGTEPLGGEPTADENTDDYTPEDPDEGGVDGEIGGEAEDYEADDTGAEPGAEEAEEAMEGAAEDLFDDTLETDDLDEDTDDGEVDAEPMGPGDDDTDEEDLDTDEEYGTGILDFDLNFGDLFDGLFGVLDGILGYGGEDLDEGMFDEEQLQNQMERFRRELGNIEVEEYDFAINERDMVPEVTYIDELFVDYPTLGTFLAANTENIPEQMEADETDIAVYQEIQDQREAETTGDAPEDIPDELEEDIQDAYTELADHVEEYVDSADSSYHQIFQALEVGLMISYHHNQENAADLSGDQVEDLEEGYNQALEAARELRDGVNNALRDIRVARSVMDFEPGDQRGEEHMEGLINPDQYPSFMLENEEYESVDDLIEFYEEGVE